MKNDQKPKVGLVFDDSLDTNDGVAQYVKNLGAWLRLNGFNVNYLVGQTDMKSFDSSKVYSLSRNLRVRFNGNRLSMPIFSDKKAIRRVIDQESFDILHVMVPYSPFMAKKIINAAAPASAIVGTFHIYPSGRIASYSTKLLRIFYGRSLKKFFAIVSVSDPAASFAKKAFNINTPIIPNPVNIAKFKNNSFRRNINSDKRIVFLGRLVKRKGCRQLIEAFSLISAQYPQLRLVIAGNGPERDNLEKRTIELGISKSVDFLGYIDETDKPKLLAEAAICCFPALYGESFGLVLIEAMAAGAEVVIGGDNPGYSSVLADKPELLFNPKNKDDFASKLKLILDDDDLRKQIYAWQQEEVKKYDINKVGKDIVNLYTTAIASVGKNSHNKHYE